LKFCCACERKSEEKKRGGGGDGGSLTHTILLGNKTCGACTFSSLAALPPSRGNGTCVLQELSVSPQHLIHLAKLLFQDKTPQQSNEAKINFANAVASVVANENIYENANTHKLLKT
jgi:hypothetical protein